VCAYIYKLEMARTKSTYRGVPEGQKAIKQPRRGGMPTTVEERPANVAEKRPRSARSAMEENKDDSGREEKKDESGREEKREPTNEPDGAERKAFPNHGFVNRHRLEIDDSAVAVRHNFVVGYWEEEKKYDTPPELGKKTIRVAKDGSWGPIITRVRQGREESHTFNTYKKRETQYWKNIEQDQKELARRMRNRRDDQSENEDEDEDEEEVMVSISANKYKKIQDWTTGENLRCPDDSYKVGGYVVNAHCRKNPKRKPKNAGAARQPRQAPARKPSQAPARQPSQDQPRRSARQKAQTQQRERIQKEREQQQQYKKVARETLKRLKRRARKGEWGEPSRKRRLENDPPPAYDDGRGGDGMDHKHIDNDDDSDDDNDAAPPPAYGAPEATGQRPPPAYGAPEATGRRVASKRKYPADETSASGQSGVLDGASASINAIIDAAAVRAARRHAAILGAAAKRQKLLLDNENESQEAISDNENESEEAILDNEARNGGQGLDPVGDDEDINGDAAAMGGMDDLALPDEDRGMFNYPVPVVGSPVVPMNQNNQLEYFADVGLNSDGENVFNSNEY